MNKFELLQWIRNCNDGDEIIVITDYDKVKITDIDTSEKGQIVIQCETVKKPCNTCSNYSKQYGRCGLGHLCLNGSEWCPKTE